MSFTFKYPMRVLRISNKLSSQILFAIFEHLNLFIFSRFTAQVLEEEWFVNNFELAYDF